MPLASPYVVACVAVPSNVGSRELLSRLDPRAPLVVDTRELGRRPGSMRRVSRSVPAPAGLGNAVLGVPAGSPVELELRLEAVMEGVLVSGTARTAADGECVRCLDPLRRELEVDLQELFGYPDLARNEDDEEALRLEGDLLDLEPALRDALVLAFPLQPLCREDCPGLCPRCGARLAEDPGHAHEALDPRWAALRGLLDADPAGAAGNGPQPGGPPSEDAVGSDSAENASNLNGASRRRTPNP